MAIRDSGAPPSSAPSARIKEAQTLMATDPRRAEQIYQDIVASQPSATSEAATREYEAALMTLGQRFRDECRAQELVDLIGKSRTVLSSFAKAKTSKLSELARCGWMDGRN